ncbi:MAG: hypothetical protein KAQ93_03525, partial [Spirochaetales bacterium]|nr:hypothetical protein [Spirochaetales bacterium]
MEIDIKSMKILIILFTVVTVLTGCFFGTAVEKTVTPTIRAITDLFAVTDIGSATLVVSGSEMETQTITLSATEMSTDFIVTIPEGVITFDLTVEMGVLYTGAVASYFGTTTETISTDNTNVIITLGVERTKIVVPDYLNSKITQFDDISGSNALSLSSAAIVSLLFTAGYTLSTFSPHNIDFDNEGRIYIANYAGSTESGFIRI